MFSMLSTALFFVLGSFLNPHFYVGVFLGIAFTGFFVAMWNLFVKKVDTAVPVLAPVLTDVTDVAKEIETVLTPVVTSIEQNPTVVGAQPSGVSLAEDKKPS